MTSGFDRRENAAQGIERALRWLDANQHPDGHWEGSTGVTSLALLAFFSAGETHRHGQHKPAIKRALRFLKLGQGEDGRFAASGDRSPNVAHALATFAMCEAYALTASPLFKQSAQAGLDLLCSIDGTDRVFRCWTGLALESARSGGLRVAEESLSSAGSGPSASAPSFPPGPGRAVEAAELRRRLLDDPLPGERDALRAELSRLALHTPGRYGEVEPGTWFLTAAALFEGSFDFEGWTAWSSAAYREITELQVKEGPNAGSWEPAGPFATPLGRAGTTALMTMTLTFSFSDRFASVFGSSH